MKMNKKGFTLIELLVVVLIIGILASIALPQYFRAVERSRASEVLSLFGSIGGAQQRYMLQHDEYTTDFDALDLEFAGADGDTLETQSYAIQLQADGTLVATRNANDRYGQYTVTRAVNGTIRCNDVGDKGACTVIGIEEEGD